MALFESLAIATELKKQLDRLRPISPEMERRIMQKFRLDWNYNSSNIEGNTLTYGETKALILFGQTAQAKPLRDYLEMLGHDEAIKYIEEVVSQERPLTEIFIREMHKIVLKEPYQVDAKTPDGKPVKRWISIGKYKTMPNHVETKTGEMFYFASPEETPAKMYDLLKWYEENHELEDIHPVVFATEFHYRFVRIHPFDDGNGRLARLLMNFVLLQKGFPPAIIKTEEKQEYYKALQQADAGQLEFFFEYVCQQVIHSLEIMLKGANGEDIEDPDDLDKKLQLLKARLGEDVNSKVQIRKSPEAIKEVVERSIKPLLNVLDKKLQGFDTLAKSRTSVVSINENNNVGGIDFITSLKDALIRHINPILDNKMAFSSIKFRCYYDGLINLQKSINFVGFTFSVKFHDFSYEISGDGIKKPITRRYDHVLDETEINKIVNALGTHLYNVFEENLLKEE
ncbi:MAG: hypothetical protein A2W90_06650 [Bacteroidetes bacterium GWF2_42_66]|nr:MAG: hypothetical protein A2W92_02010 [Bacteroidetes bacterium GWA2_42_15]OFY02833.1 MAG: hypothetical protein A2W89_24060 [Bacteroidetes bacterium GWE2_42_39]OFY44487.1 MAG: hypothetical protein A2W90_06650 [Bacteroidetes bacterium GWF2_42_66]HBL74967.1 hypothetical protein [Prolixibacteraceae bacterium]HCR89272.1 hypothetical protein [Prolixibacteraceae bacterium]